MNEDAFFCHLDSVKIAEFISSAKRAVVYAAPSIQMLPAQAIVEVSKTLGTEMLTVNMDIDEHVIRMGYGDVDAIGLLQNSNISINHSPHLRTALIIVDDRGFSFTPTALFLEPENTGLVAFNAIRLTAEQVIEALARLSPVAKSIAVAQAKSEDEKQRLTNLPIDVDSSPMSQTAIKDIRQSLDNAPPVDFDIARQVRVYETRLQYVDISFTGASLQNRTITIPTSIQALGNENDELEGRLTARFNLIKNNDMSTATKINAELAKIRKSLTTTIRIDGHSERFLLKRLKPLFENSIKELRENILSHKEKVRSGLDEELKASKALVVKYYLPIVKKKPPMSLLARCQKKPTNGDCMTWISEELSSVFPKAEELIKEISLTIRYKDVTFETLKEPQFLEQIKDNFPYEPWDKAHDEYTAAAQRK